MRLSTATSRTDPSLLHGLEASPREDSLEADVVLARVRRELCAVGSGTRLGRFAVLEPLGRGAQATVYAAHDPVLERRVAIKVPRRCSLGSPRRMRSEARALARVRHPHLVTVHELCEVGERTVVVMELIEGAPLLEWIARETPRLEVVVEVLAAVAGALQALHRAGLQHRDVKPANIVVRRDGVACLVDLGLAADVGGEGSRGSGTPSFMAPEQRACAAPDPAADQYALAATIRAAVARYRQPRWLRRCLERGLADRPSDRYPDVRTFGLELRAGFSRRRRLGAAAGLALIAAAGWWGTTADAARCSERADAVGAVWDEAARDRVRGHLTGLDAGAGARSLAALDAWAASWSVAARHACTSDDEQRGPPRTACLDEAATQFGDVVAAMTLFTSETAYAAASLVHTLPEPGTCLDTDVPAAVFARDYGGLPAAMRARAQAASLARLCDAGVIVDCEDRIDSIADRLGDVDTCQWEPHLDLRRAWIHTTQGRLEDAVAGFKRAAHEAEACRQGAVELEAKRAVAELLGVRLGRFERSQTWFDLARASLTRMGGPARPSYALLASEGHLAYVQGRFDAATAKLMEALARLDQLRDGPSGDRAHLLESLGIAYADLEDYGQAEELLRRARSEWTATLGPEHPRVAAVVANLATVVYIDSLDRALQLNAEALKIYAKWPHYDAVTRADALLQRAAYMAEAHDEPEALALANEALALYRSVLPDSHHRVAQVENLRAVALTRMGAWGDAVAAGRRAVTIATQSLGLTHPDTVEAARTLADVHALRGWTDKDANY